MFLQVTDHQNFTKQIDQLVHLASVRPSAHVLVGGLELAYLTHVAEKALSMLPSDQREAFLLKHVEEMSYDEIAGITGISVSALKMRVKRACDTLRDLLEGVYNG